MDNQRLKRVLIIKPSSLGDIIHALPVAAALKAGLPGVEIDWVAGRGYEEVLAGNPAISSVISFDRGMLKKGGGLGRFAAFVRELRKRRYDLALDLQGLLRSGLMAFASRADRRVGFANAREGAAWFYTDKVPVPDTGIHAVERYLLTTKWLGVKASAAPEFTINLSDSDIRQAERLLDESGIAGNEAFVAVAPSARWRTKRWPVDNFVRLANMMVENEGVRSVFVGTREDEILMAGGRERLLPGASLAFGRTSIKGLAALLKKARLLVTNDSGPMHIAASVGTPVIAVFGPTDPKRTGPYGGMHKVVSSGEDCSPCFKKECDTVKCLTGITEEQVYETVKEMVHVNRQRPA